MYSLVTVVCRLDASQRLQTGTCIASLQLSVGLTRRRDYKQGHVQPRYSSL